MWIVSNIVRAVNDKTAKDLLGEQFRRQVLHALSNPSHCSHSSYDGSYDGLAQLLARSGPS